MVSSSFGRRRWVLVVTAVLTAAAGCGKSPPRPADHGRAREALGLALDAWQQGQDLPSLQQRKPPIRVKDPDWKAGFRLVRYQAEAGSPFGAELRCSVLLTLQSRSGQTLQKRAVYGVGTSPALTVLREEDP